MKNNYKTVGDVTFIELVRADGRIILTSIDTNQLEKVKEFPNIWYAVWKKQTNSFYVYGYLYSKNKQKTIYLHRWIMNPPDGMVIDHINHDTVENLCSNLRIVTPQQNYLNKKISSRNTSGARGVVWNKKENKWRVKFKIFGVYKSFGQYKEFEKAKEAARDIESKLIV
jgi:hypothetical protein